MRKAIHAPAYWTDHELAILVMPISRTVNQLNMLDHVVLMPQATTAAA